VIATTFDRGTGSTQIIGFGTITVSAGNTVQLANISLSSISLGTFFGEFNTGNTASLTLVGLTGGAVGATGATGATGTIGAVSNYLSGTTYSAGTVVYCQAAGNCSTAGQGSSYVYINGSSSAGNNPPNTTYWQQIAAAGANGSNGATGATGAAGATGSVSSTSFEFNTEYNDSGYSGADLYFAPMPTGQTNNGGTSPGFSSSSVGVVPLACTINQMSIGGLETYVGSAETVTFTLYYGTTGVSPTTASSITCTTASIPGGSGNTGSCSDTTHTLSVTAGEMLSIREHLSNESGSGSAFNWGVHLSCQ
jgi:hypothetical protein